MAPGHAFVTSTYNGAAPGPLIRMTEGVPATVEVFNRTGVTEYVHWHGFEIPPELDGTEEEGSLAVPAGGRLRYEITPHLAGSRYVHSHAMTMNDLSRGHVLNASATENVQLHLPGHKFEVVALDGNPVPRPAPVSVLELGVGERVDAFVEMNNPGVWVLGSVADSARRGGMGVRLEYANRSGEPQYAPPGDAPWDYLLFGRRQESPKPDDVIPMRILRVAPDEHGMERWSINGHLYSDRDEPKVLTRGRRYRLAFDNRTPEAHPLHLHRYSFELVRIGAAATAGMKKDDITLQPYQTVEVDFVPQEAGLALFHCHQQMHMEMGFKYLFRVV